MRIHVNEVHHGIRYQCGVDQCNFKSPRKSKLKKHCTETNHDFGSLKTISVRAPGV